MKKILYIGKFIPNKGAAGIHAHNIAQCLKQQDVNLIYMAYKDNREDFSEIVYNVSKRGRIINLFDICFGWYEFRAFKQIVEKEQPDAVILYNATNAFAKKVIKYCNVLNIRIIIENTEWYTLASISSGLANYLLTRSVDRRIRLTDQYSDGIIAISTYLEEFYRQQGVRVYNLPPLFSCSNNMPDYTYDCDRLMFVYAGAPGNKDILCPFVNSIYELVEREGLNVEFHIYGIDSIQLSNIMDTTVDYSKHGVFAHGIVSHDEVLEAVSKSHYTILLRYPERYAKAGYSTKVAESLSLGTPIICNNIGGTDKDIENGKTGFVISDYDTNTIKDIIRFVNDVKDDEYLNIRKNCIEYALRRYSPDMYYHTLYNFIFEK